MRSTAATDAASDSATSARRKVFIGARLPTGREGYGADMEYRVVRRTDRFDESVRFWRDVMGWPVTREWPASESGGRGCIVGYGDVARFELIEVDDAEAVEGLVLSIEHADVAALHEQLLANGVAVARGIADQPWGHRSFVINDPSGVEVTFFQWI